MATLNEMVNLSRAKKENKEYEEQLLSEAEPLEGETQQQAYKRRKKYIKDTGLRFGGFMNGKEVWDTPIYDDEEEEYERRRKIDPKSVPENIVLVSRSQYPDGVRGKHKMRISLQSKPSPLQSNLQPIDTQKIDAGKINEDFRNRQEQRKQLWWD